MKLAQLLGQLGVSLTRDRVRAVQRRRRQDRHVVVLARRLPGLDEDRVVVAHDLGDDHRLAARERRVELDGLELAAARGGAPGLHHRAWAWTVASFSHRPVYFVWGVTNEIDGAVSQWRERARAGRAVVGEEDAVLRDEPGDLP